MLVALFSLQPDEYDASTCAAAAMRSVATIIYFLIFYLFSNSDIEFNTSITQIQGSQQQQYKPEKERKGYK